MNSEEVLRLCRFYAIIHKKVGDLMKRLFSILIVFIIIFSLSACKKGYESAPQITEGEFPFVLEYEINDRKSSKNI